MKTEERIFLDEHPLVLFVNTPICNVLITDGVTVRERVVEVRKCKSDLIDRLKSEQGIKNKMFVVYASCENTVFSNITYDPFSFEPVRYIRYTEIDLSTSEWKYLYSDKLKERDDAYQEFLLNENKRNKNYNYLLIGR